MLADRSRQDECGCVYDEPTGLVTRFCELHEKIEVARTAWGIAHMPQMGLIQESER